MRLVFGLISFPVRKSFFMTSSCPGPLQRVHEQLRCDGFLLSGGLLDRNLLAKGLPLFDFKQRGMHA